MYKGRKKKTIQYYAIKSVDKSQKARVLQEVRARFGACKQWLKASKAARPLSTAPWGGGTPAAGGGACWQLMWACWHARLKGVSSKVLRHTACKRSGGGCQW